MEKAHELTSIIVCIIMIIMINMQDVRDHATTACYHSNSNNNQQQNEFKLENFTLVFICAAVFQHISRRGNKNWNQFEIILVYPKMHEQSFWVNEERYEFEEFEVRPSLLPRIKIWKKSFKQKNSLRNSELKLSHFFSSKDPIFQTKYEKSIELLNFFLNYNCFT